MEKCIHHLFEEQAGQTPEAVAVEFEGQQLTYAALDARANQLAERLRRLGVGPEVIVPIFVRRSLEMVVGVLGILKAGGAYLPLDPAYPKERLQFMLADAGASVVVTHVDLASDLPPNSVTAVCLNSIAGQQETSAPRPIAEPVRSENLAYVIYTSGSTGRPKAVEVCHRSAVNLLMSVVAELGLTAQDTMLAVTTLSFDVSVAEIFLPLLTGGRLSVASRKVAADGFMLLDALRSSRPTIMCPTPATWRLLLAAGWAGTPGLRIISTGEALPRGLANQLLSKGAGLWNFYGPTETTVWSTYWRVTSERGPILIGKPLANTAVYILDADLKPLPQGETGELYIGGDGLANGYLNQPELTAMRFIPDPFSRNPGARLYKTGDLARYDADGNIECLGRIDHQVKIRGYRIELGEVEEVLAEHPAVREAAVVSRESGSGSKDLLGYVVLRQGLEVGAVELREHLKAKLPEYMLPSVYVRLDRLPLTPSGKVDRRALPQPEMAGRLDSNTHVAPRTDRERRLVEIWQQVLGLDGLGVNDNFLELGGDSLRAIELVQRVEDAFGVRLPVESVYQAPTAAEFQGLLDQQTTTKLPAGVACLQGEGQGSALFCLHVMPHHLARLLKPDFRVYGLHTPLEEGVLQWLQTGRLDLTVAELAARYLRLLKSVQPEGPYNLLGHSFGGLIAFEIARRLYEENKRGGILCIIDSFYLGGLKPSRLPQVRRWAYHLPRILRDGPRYVLMHLNNRRKVAERYRDTIGKLETHGSRKLRSQARRIWVTQQQYMTAAASLYRGGPYPGDALLFRAGHGRGLFSHIPESTNGWRSVIQGRIDVVDVDCGHSEFFEAPLLQVVAERLLRALQTIKLPT